MLWLNTLHVAVAALLMQYCSNCSNVDVHVQQEHSFSCHSSYHVLPFEFSAGSACIGAGNLKISLLPEEGLGNF